VYQFRSKTKLISRVVSEFSRRVSTRKSKHQFRRYRTTCTAATDPVEIFRSRETDPLRSICFRNYYENTREIARITYGDACFFSPIRYEPWTFVVRIRFLSRVVGQKKSRVSYCAYTNRCRWTRRDIYVVPSGVVVCRQFARRSSGSLFLPSISTVTRRRKTIATRNDNDNVPLKRFRS